MMEDSITERTGLIRRTTLGRNDIQRDHATNLAQQTGEGGDGLPPLPPSGGGKFKKVSTLVIAMNRFKSSLNPTYTFGKRSDSQGSFNSSGRDSPEVCSPQGSAPITSQPEGGLDPAGRVYSSRGHKTSYILRPLPAADNEQQLKVSRDD